MRSPQSAQNRGRFEQVSKNDLQMITMLNVQKLQNKQEVGSINIIKVNDSF